MPRAFYVPRVETVPDPKALLTRLADGHDDFHEVALIEEPLASGFTGVSGPTDEVRVTFVTNEPEHVVLRVDAPARGFVHLSDQHFPGWTATVNDVPTSIMRTNYLFRLVEVPAGTSVVEFRYQPWSVRIGAAVSALTIASLLAVAVVRRSRRRGRRI
jgi:hypothetical protein